MLRDVTNSSTQNICIYCYWSRLLLYRPYIRTVCTGVKNAPVNTGHIYGPYIRRSVHTTRIYGPYSQKALRTMVFLYGPYIYGPYVWVSKMQPYIWAVYTGARYGLYIWPVYIRVHGTHYLYRRTVQLKRIAVLYGPYIRVTVCTTRKYGPYIRVSKIHPYVWAVHTCRIYR